MQIFSNVKFDYGPTYEVVSCILCDVIIIWTLMSTEQHTIKTVVNPATCPNGDAVSFVYIEAYYYKRPRSTWICAKLKNEQIYVYICVASGLNTRLTHDCWCHTSFLQLIWEKYFLRTSGTIMFDLYFKPTL